MILYKYIEHWHIFDDWIFEEICGSTVLVHSHLSCTLLVPRFYWYTGLIIMILESASHGITVYLPIIQMIKVKIHSLRSVPYSTDHYLSLMHVNWAISSVPGSIKHTLRTNMQAAWTTHTQFSSARYPSLLGRKALWNEVCLTFLHITSSWEPLNFWSLALSIRPHAKPIEVMVSV